MISYDDFKKVEIKIGKVLSAERIPDSEKLIKLVFDLGAEQREVIAGVAKSYPDPSVLVGKEMPVVVNLEPKTMMGQYTSYGMILAADADGRPVVLEPDE